MAAEALVVVAASFHEAVAALRPATGFAYVLASGVVRASLKACGARVAGSRRKARWDRLSAGSWRQQNHPAVSRGAWSAMLPGGAAIYAWRLAATPGGASNCRGALWLGLTARCGPAVQPAVRLSGRVTASSWMRAYQ